MEIVKINSISSVCCTRCSVWYDNTAVPDEEYSGSIRLPRQGGLLSIELYHTSIRRRCLKVSTAFCCHNSNMSSRVICFKQDARCRNHLGKMYSTTEMSFLFQSARFCFSQLTEIKLNMSEAWWLSISAAKKPQKCVRQFLIRYLFATIFDKNIRLWANMTEILWLLLPQNMQFYLFTSIKKCSSLPEKSPCGKWRAN